MIEEYYNIAPLIVAKLEMQPNAMELFNVLYNRILISVNLIEAGQNEEALQNYIDMVLDLKEKYI